MNRALFTAALSLGLTACTVGSDYAPPAIATVGQWRGPPSRPIDPQAAWWKVFNDPMLNTLIETALAQNLDIEQAMARVDQARASLGAAGLALYPAGGIDAQATRTRQSTESGLGRLSGLAPGFSRTTSQFDATAGASWELDLAGGIRRGREAAAYEFEAAQASGAAVRLTIAGEIADAYVQLRALQENLQIARAQSSASDRLLALIRKRAAAGESPRREVEQANADAAGARAVLAPLGAQSEAQLNRILVLLGRMPQSDRLGLDTPASLPVATLGEAGAPDDLLRRRPDLIAAERRLAAAHARIGVALAEYYPKLSLSGLFGFQSNTASNLFGSSANVIQGAAGLRWRLFDFVRIDAEVAGTKGAEREALAAYRQAVLRAAEDVETSFAALQAAQAQSLELQRQIDSTKRARGMAETAWRGGEVSLIEVLQADRDLLAAQLAYLSARAEAARSLIACRRALGG